MTESEIDPAAFATAYHRFMEWVNESWKPATNRNEVVALVGDYLGAAAREHSVVARSVPPFDQVNLQTALDVWMLEPGRSVSVHGIALPPHHGPVRLQQLISGDGMPPVSLSAPALIDLANGPDSTLACLVLGLLLVEDDLGRYVVMVIGPSEHEQGLAVEIAGLPVGAAQAVHAHLDALRREHNVYRGHILDVALTPRTEVRQHTTRYLLGQMTGYTRLVLSGRALHAIGAATDLARELQPAALVLEDVDLVAEDRSFGPGSSPVLFDLLDAMDGAAADADLLFILTTNRADLLEPALAARPGRVDVAVEIDLPDAASRQRLFQLYAGPVPMQLTPEEEAEVVERTDGVTASFLKELLRRAVLEALQEQHDQGDVAALRLVTARHVSRALDDLLDAAQQVTRSLLGVGNDPQDLPAGGGVGGLPPIRRGFTSRRGIVWSGFTPG